MASHVLYSSTLYKEELMKRIIDYVMQKLKDTNKTSQKVIQLLEILATLCDCKGVPVEHNQGNNHHPRFVWTMSLRHMYEADIQ